MSARSVKVIKLLAVLVTGAIWIDIEPSSSATLL
jgi:hypothetical protein